MAMEDVVVEQRACHELKVARRARLHILVAEVKLPRLGQAVGHSEAELECCVDSLTRPDDPEPEDGIEELHDGAIHGCHGRPG